MAKERSYEIRVIGAQSNLFGDWYHALLRMPWSYLLIAIFVAFLVMNSIFASFYVLSDGVMHMRKHSYEDAFYFSAQTMGTIGYGAMYPEGRAANLIVVTESFVSVIMTAMATGLVFTKFARPVGRVAFSKEATLTLMEGVPTLSFRVGNERKSTIVEGTIHVAYSRTITTAEGLRFYRMVDLKLARERSPAIAKSWTVLHHIDEASPLYGATPESFAKEDAELIVSLAGTDDTSYQPVYARHTYEAPEILWGMRHVDILSEEGDNVILDLRRFHEVMPTKATAAFPYPRPAKAEATLKVTDPAALDDSTK
ncbi:MAG: ion channel [Polyangiaceae bacterium]